MQRKVLVAGAQGVIGRAAATRLAARPDTQVLGLSRRTEPSIPNVEAVSVDLLDTGQVRDRLGGIRDVTHIVFGAYIEKQTAAEKSTVNVAILRNLLDVVEETSPACATSRSTRAARPTAPISARSRRPPAKTTRA